MPVKMTIPINYDVTNKTYGITVTNQSMSVSGNVTQRKATLTNESVTFTADSDFYRRSTETRSSIKVVMSEKTLQGQPISVIGMNADPYRWDFAADENTLELIRDDDSVKHIYKVDFEFHSDLIPVTTVFCPSRIDIAIANPEGTDSLIDTDTDWTWNREASPVKDAVLTLVKGTRTIALKNFTVYFTRATWK